MKKNNFGMSIGSSSLLLIFVVLSLISFSVLSLSSSLADRKLADKVVTKNFAYYEACNVAEEKLSTLDLHLFNLYNEGISKEDYFAQVMQGTSFAVPVSQYQALQVDVTFLYPEQSGDSFYEITSWKLVNVDTPQIDDSLPVMR